MEITDTMDLGQLTERMGNMATTGDASVMRDLLVERGYAGQDTADIPWAAWADLMELALS